MTTLTRNEFSPYLDNPFRGYTAKRNSKSKPEPKACVASFFDRPARRGKLIAFLPDQRTLTVQESDSKVSVNFAFDDIRSVLLTEPVDVKRSAAHFKKHGIVVHSIDHQAPFRIVYRDGLEFEGFLRGYGVGQQGLGVYLVIDRANNESSGMCCYFPASSISTFSVGEKLGALLLKQGDLTEAGLTDALIRQSELRDQKLGGLLMEQRVISASELENAIRGQSAKPIKKLGEVLVALGIITDVQLTEALEEQARRRATPLGEILVEMGLVAKDVIREVLAQKLGIPYVDLTRFSIETDAFRAIPTLLMLQNNAIPLYWSGQDLVVAMKDPLDARAIDALSFAAHARIIPVLASKEDIAVALRRGPKDDYALWNREGVPDQVAHVTGKNADAAITWLSSSAKAGEFALQLDTMPGRVTR